ncbi:MAG: DUF2490 domain-containing protein [Muribaculaceae bacterium]|nr:DUF2490 domain-containing protein [Muribaculaceae bacterium]
MGKCSRYTIGLLLLASMAIWCTDAAAEDDFGMSYSLGVEKKFSKKTKLEAEAELRTRNDTKTLDRWSLEVSASHKLTPWLKAEAGYLWLYDNNREKITYNTSGSYNNWRPSYWGTRHRFHVSLTGSFDIGRFGFSIRERYQYTYRPTATTTRYDFDNEWWEDTEVKSKHDHTLRSRLKIDYNIPKSKLTPYVSAELFNDMSLTKSRFMAGADYTLKKKHTFGAFYRYQIVNSNDNDNETNEHMIGFSYKYKF